MNESFKFLNFSFKDEKISVNLKDYINNIHTVTFNSILYLENHYNNFPIKLFYGKLTNRIGELQVFFTNFIGLYSIFDTPELIFYAYDEEIFNYRDIIRREEFTRNLQIFQISDLLFLIIFYPEDKILKKINYSYIYDGDIINYINNINLKDIFEKEIMTLDDYIHLLPEFDPDQIQFEYQEMQEKMEYDSLHGNEDEIYNSLDEEDKRGIFGEKYFWDKLSSVDGEQDNVKSREMKYWEGYNQLKDKLDKIIIINKYEITYYDEYGGLNCRSYITLLIPPKLTDTLKPQLVNIDLYGNSYFSGKKETVFIVGIPQKDVDNLNSIRTELGLSLEDFIKFDKYFVYIKILNKDSSKGEIDNLYLKLNEIDNRNKNLRDEDLEQSKERDLPY